MRFRQRANVYQTIDPLERDGLIAARETTREEKRPERTVYELTDEGNHTVRLWVHEALSTPKREFPEFPVAIAYLPLLAPEDTLRQLETRVAALELEVARIESQLRGDAVVVPRLFLLEMEYLRAMLQSELEWVRTVIGCPPQATPRAYGATHHHSK